MEDSSFPILPGFEAASRLVDKFDPWVLETQMALTSIPAPPFGETERGKRMAELFAQVGLLDLETDDEGNVLAALPGDVLAPGSGPHSSPLIVSAHLDTVFPAGTDVEPRRSGGQIRAPGIADDGRGLAALLALARVILEAGLSLPCPVIFVATVGEEGVGNLRGVRHLFREGGPGRNARGFISLDGIGLDRIIVRGVGSTRLRITLKGPGGHSWTDWGLPNPIHALGEVVEGIDTLPLPSSPRTTATVARWGGGKSINAIPEEAWMEVDLRSEGAEELKGLELALLERCRGVLPGKTGRGGKAGGEGMELAVAEIGRRPAGATPEDSPLVQAAKRATEALEVTPHTISSSTDANVPMSLGIPAITLGAGGRAGGIHTLGEWYSNERGPEGILRALLTVVFLDQERGA